MRRLRDFHLVTIHVGEAALEGRVAAVHGDEALIDVPRPLPAATGFLPATAHLTFDHEGHTVALQGLLQAGGDGGTLRFVVGDGVRQTDKRRHVRLAAGLTALVTPLEGTRDAGDTIATRTVDISGGGVLLDAGPLRGRVRVAVELPAGRLQPGGRVVEAIGDVVRSDEHRSAVAFTHLDAGEQALLIRFVDEVRRSVARRLVMTG